MSYPTWPLAAADPAEDDENDEPSESRGLLSVYIFPRHSSRRIWYSSSISLPKSAGSVSAFGSATRPKRIDPLKVVTVTPSDMCPGSGTNPMMPPTRAPRNVASVGDPITLEKIRVAFWEYVCCRKLQSQLFSILVVKRMKSIVTGTLGPSLSQSMRCLHNSSRRRGVVAPTGSLRKSAPTRLFSWYVSFFERTLTGIMHLRWPRKRLPSIRSRYLASAPERMAQHVSFTVPWMDAPMFVTVSCESFLLHQVTRARWADF
mmetsp:Transcript_32063/g.74002  ORF Transcript_32063/g.74002 Transcript_32063/m.74002 type:complete len:260 (+) Transcript_32063:38-817(+)